MPTRAGIAAALLVSCALAGVMLMPPRLEAATFLGKVVDAKTGEPLEGAVVVVIWSRYLNRPELYLLPHPGSGSLLYKAVEGLTDSRGEFSVDVSSGLILSKLHSRQVVIVKPGYQPLENS